MELLIVLRRGKEVQNNAAPMKKLSLINNQPKRFTLVPVNQVNDDRINFRLRFASHHRDNTVVVSLKHNRRLFKVVC